MIAGLIACFGIQYVDYFVLYKWYIPWMVYFAGIVCVLLLLTPMGVSANGATRWLDLKVIQFQVAELVKIGVIIFEAYMIQRFRTKLHKKFLVAYMWAAGGIAAILLVIISNDLSSAIVVAAITYLLTLIYTKTWKLHFGALGIVGAGVGAWVYSIASNLPTSAELDDMSFRVARIAAWIAPCPPSYFFYFVFSVLPFLSCSSESASEHPFGFCCDSFYSHYYM